MALLKKLVKYISVFFAVGIIIAAIAVCLSRFITPILVQHRADFEGLASDLLRSPVTVSSVHASWYHYEPELSLNDVTIYDATTKQPAMHIERLSVFISLPQSLWHRKFVVNGVLVSGSSIDIQKDASGKFIVQGMKTLANNDSPNRTNVWALLAWLTQEQRVILQDIDLHYSDVKHEARFVSLYDLQITNDGSAHTIAGIATLHQNLPTKMKVAIEWDGENFDPAKITAKGYFYLSGLDLSQWFHSYNWRGWQIKQGVASSKIWLNWDNGAMQKVQVLTQAYGLELFSQNDNTTHVINRFSGSFGWKRDGLTQIFAGEDILVDFPDSLWPVSSFYLALQPDANGVLQPQLIKIGYLNLPDVYRFMSAEQRAWITKINLTGVLQNLAITFPNTWTDWTQLGMNASFNQVHFLPWGKMPGVTNLSGHLKWDGAQGDVDFNSQQSDLSLKEYFTNDIPLKQLSGSVQIQRDKNVWRLITPKLQLSNDDIAIALSGNVIVPADANSIVNLQADFSLLHAEKVSQYLPVKTFDKDFSLWLESAFSAGSAQGHGQISGGWDKFPYKDGSGIFKISADVKNITLKYAPDWPLISNINGKLNFDADKVTVDVNQAELANSEVSQITAEIPSLMADQVFVNVHAKDLEMDFSNAVAFIHNSPLESNIGEIFKGKDFNGNIKLNLQLSVPLASPDKTRVQGILNMQDNEMDILRTGLVIDHLQGNIAFTEDSVAANQVTGTLFNKPLTLNLSTLVGKNASPIQAQFKTSIAVDDLEKWLAVPFSKVMQGATDVSGTLLLSLHQGVTLNLTSNLVGVAVTLPENYGKTAKEARAFNLQLTAHEPDPLKLLLNYNKLLSAALVFSPKDEGYSLTAVDMHIGNGIAAFPETPGLYMMGSFDTLDFSQLQKYWLDSSPQTFALPDNLVLRNIEISANTFKIGSLVLEEISAMITPEKTDWLIALNSPDLDGQLRIPKNFNADAVIDAEFNKLNITPSDTVEAEALLNLKNLPAINFSCKDTSYNTKSFGEVEFNTEPTATGMDIKSLKITSQLMNLDATGTWNQANNVSSTQLEGTLQSNQVGGLLKNFGMDVNNFVIETGSVTFNLDWNDAPYKFALVNANGTMRLQLGKGRIVDIGQQNGATMDLGRMLSIFSLQTIPRRLSLDFSDVFLKGYSFDKVTGDLTLKGGNIYTSNFKFNGPVAMVGINGRIGLKDKDYDFTLIVTPYVTSSVPVAAALLTMQPLVGLAAFAVNSVIGPSLNKTATYYYTVTGPWSNPVWKTISVAQPGRRR